MRSHKIYKCQYLFERESRKWELFDNLASQNKGIGVFGRCTENYNRFTNTGIRTLKMAAFQKSVLRIFAPSQVNLYDLTKLVVYGERGSRRLDVDCSTGRRPMERADEPPPPILLYQVGFGCILKWWRRSGWVEKRKGPR